MKKEDFLCKNDTEVLLELGEVPQLKDRIKHIFEEFVAKKIVCFSVWSYFYVSDKRIIGIAFSKKDLRRIPEPIFKLDALKELHLEENRITTIPDGISKLKNLTMLFLASNRIRIISDSLNCLDSLEYLDLKRNRIKNLPKDISNLRKLESFYLNKNDLQQLPESITRLDKLRYLDITYNPNLILSYQINKFLSRERDGSKGYPLGQKIMNVKGLDEILVAPYVRKFSMREKKVLERPISEPKNQKSFISDLNITLQEKKILEELESKTGVAFTVVEPYSGKSRGHGKYMEVCVEEGVVTELGIYDVGLPEFPSVIQELSRLRFLSLVGNKLEKLPPKLVNLTHLRRLCLSDNLFTRLPDNIGSLHSLEELIINNIAPMEEYYGVLPHIRIETLPPSIGVLKSLKSLSLMGNHLRYLPPSIGNLQTLQELNVRFNYIEELPDSIGGLKNLKELYISDNFLVSLPESMKNLESLEQISLNNNPKKILDREMRSGTLEIPDWLYTLPSLKEIDNKSV